MPHVLLCNYSWAHLPGPRFPCNVSPLNYKRGGTCTVAGGRDAQTLDSQNNTTYSGCTVLRFGSPNHYNPYVLVLIQSVRQIPKPPPHIRIKAGALRHPVGGFPLRQRVFSSDEIFVESATKRWHGGVYQEVRRGAICHWGP